MIYDDEISEVDTLIHKGKKCLETCRVAKLTSLAISTVASYVGFKLKRYAKDLIEIQSVKDFLLYQQQEFVRKDYNRYRKNALIFGYLPRTFEAFTAGDIETFATIPAGYIHYKHAIPLIECSESSMLSYVAKRYIKCFSEEYHDLLELVDLGKFKMRNEAENLIFCDSCKCKLNYLRFKRYSQEVCDLCVEKNERHRIRDSQKEQDKKRREALEEEKRNQRTVASKKSWRDEVPEKQLFEIQQIIRLYGLGIKSYKAIRHEASEEKARYIIELCDHISLRKKPSFLKHWRNAAHFRLLKLKEQSDPRLVVIQKDLRVKQYIKAAEKAKVDLKRYKSQVMFRCIQSRLSETLFTSMSQEDVENFLSFCEQFLSCSTKQREIKFTEQLMSMASDRIQELERRKNIDYDVSILGYRFDF